jgi:heat shock protein HspQ
MQTTNGMNGSSGIVSGQYQVGDRVKHPLYSYCGTVCEVGTGPNAERVRVQWSSKRTWVDADRLRAPGPA